MRIAKALPVVLVSLAAVGLLQGQIATDDEIRIISQPYVPQNPHAIRVQSTIVEVGAVVRDSNGKVVSGLRKEDFEVYDQGKRQTISFFNAESVHPIELTGPPRQGDVPPAPPAPLYLGMYFDDENMSTGEVVFARQAAEAFVRKNMSDTDRAGIFTSSTTVTQQFAADKQQTLNTLAKLLSHQRGATFSGRPNITPYQAFEITKFSGEHSDAFDLAMTEAAQCHTCTDSQDCARYVETKAATVLSLSEDFAQDSLGVLGDVIRYMAKKPGRRMLIMASSGFFSESQTVQRAQDKMIDAALHAGIVINTLDAKGLAADSPYGADGEQVALTGAMQGYQSILASEERDASNDSLAALADGTGGIFFHNRNDLDAGFRQMAALPAASYVLGFSPDDVKDNGVYHNLKVRVPGKSENSISARPGYFARTKEQAAPTAKFQKLNREVLAADTLTEIAATVGTQSGTLATGESALKVSVHVDGRNLSYKKQNKRHTGRIIFITALFDEQNHYLAGTETVMDMSLKDSTRTQIAHDGVDAKLTLQAPPGNYHLREVVQDVVGGKMAAFTQSVQIQ